MRSCLMVANSTCMEEVVERLNGKFKAMYDKRAFIHHYVGAGMEESELSDAQENLWALQKDY